MHNTIYKRGMYGFAMAQAEPSDFRKERGLRRSHLINIKALPIVLLNLAVWMITVDMASFNDRMGSRLSQIHLA